MKRLLITVLFLFLLPFSLVSTNAQESTPVFDFNRAYQDYLFSYNQYRDAHNEYITAKEQYFSYKTLTAKTLALEQTLSMLQKRDETIRTYLTALRSKMSEITRIANYNQNTLYLKLDREVSWYAEHRDRVTSAATLEDSVKSSKETEDRYPKTQVLAYQALGTIFEGKENGLKSQVHEQLEAIKEKISQIREGGNKDTTTAERWLLEAENKLTRSQEKLDAAKIILNSMKSSDRDKEKKYTQSQELFQESHLYLKEANSYLRELIREIKTND